MSEDERAQRAVEAAERGEAGDATTRRLAQMLDMLAEFSPGRRGVCPEREELVAHHDGLLDADRAAAVTGHVAACPFCRSELADLEALTAPPLLDAVVQLAREGLRLLDSSFAAWATPLPAPVRGEEPAPAIEMHTLADDLDLQLRVDHGSAHTADVRLMVRRAGLPLARTRISLFRDDALLESRVSQQGEEIAFDDVPPGDYTVAVAPTGGDEVARVSLSLQTETTAGA